MFKKFINLFCTHKKVYPSNKISWDGAVECKCAICGKVIQVKNGRA